MSKSIAVLIVAGVFGATTALAGQDRLIAPGADGPGQGGMVGGILNFSSDVNLVYAAILGAGIYKSTDAGATWTAKNSGLGHFEVRTIRAKPGSTTVLYVPTDGGAGFYKSTDGGESWQASNTGLDCRFVRNANVASGSAGVVMAGTVCGAYRSTDEGATWSKMCSANLFSTVNSLNSDSTGQFIRMATSTGVFFSGDFGATCFQSTNGLSGPNGPSVNDVRITTTNTLVAAVQGNGVFVTTDNGANWTQAAGIPAGSYPIGGFGQVGAAAPSNVWVAFDGGAIYKSTDSGLNWALDTTLTGLPGHMRFLFAGPGGTWWAATFAGVYKSIDSGANWTKTSTGLPNGHAVNLAGRSTSLLDVDLQTVYAPVERVYKSTDGGGTWALSDNGLDGKLTYRAGGLTVVPNDANTLYVSTVNHGIYKSTNAGASWFPANTGLPSNLVSGTPDFRIAPSNSQVLYATFETGLGVFKSVNGGASWTDMSGTLPVGDARIVNRPTVHPTNPDIVYVATRAGVFRSIDGGTTWLYKSPGTFAGFPVNRVEISVNNPQLVLAVASYSDALDRAYTVSGAYLSRDAGDSWIQLVGNEKISHARLVENPGGSTDAYLISNGYFDEFDSSLYKCVGLENSDTFNDHNCIQVAETPGQGRLWSLTVPPGRLRAVATTTGIYRQRFLFLGPDVNNDSRADIFWRNSGDGQNWLWLMHGNGFVGENTQGASAVGQLRTVDSPWAIAAFGDFNGDGKTDVLWRNSSTGENYIYFMDRFIILPTEGYIRTITDQNWQVAGTGDFNNDGRADILWRNSSTGENYVYFMNGLQISSEGYVRTVADVNWQVKGVGDFDGDQKADILWRNSVTGENYVYPMDGLSVKPTEGYLRNVPAPWTIAGLGDFNQDDRMDIVWRNTSTGENYVYPMDGTTILPTEGYLPTVPDTGWSIAGLGDFDGSSDGDARGVSDILWRHTSGSNYVWRMSGPTTTSSLCGQMGCTNGYLPTINASGFGVVNK